MDNDQQEKSGQKNIDLSKLYPSALSYAQIAERRQAIARQKDARTSRLVRFDPLIIAAGLSFSILVAAVYIKALPSIIWTNPYSGPSISIIFCFFTFLPFFFTARKMRSYAKAKKSGSLLFFAAYIIAILPQLYASLHIGDGTLTDVVGSVYIVVSNLIIVGALLGSIYNQRFSQERKLSFVVAVVILSSISGFAVVNVWMN